MCFKQSLQGRAGYEELMADFFNSNWLGDVFVHKSQNFRKKIVHGKSGVGQQCFMAGFLIKLHEKQKSFLQITDHKGSCIVRICETFNKKFPENLLQFACTVKRTIENVQRLPLIYIKNSSQIRTSRLDAYICCF